MELAVLLALAGSASYAVAAVTQQRAAARLPKGRAFDLAVLAAIPTPITGTPIGLGLLAWTGLGRLLGRTPPK